MSGAVFYDRLLEAPTERMTDSELMRWLYDLWMRTGGFDNAIPNLSGLIVSVAEMNTLSGINTTTTVQAQLDAKFDKADAGTMASQNANNVSIAGGVIENVSITSSSVQGILATSVGLSNTSGKVGASLYVNTAPAANSGSTETILMSYTVAADSLGTNGDYLDINAWGSFAANTNNKRLRAYFGSTVIYDSTALAINNGNFLLEAKIVRDDSADQQIILKLFSNNVTLPQNLVYTLASEDDTAPILIKITAECVATNDLTQDGFTIKWFPT
jgi:hypothetical protein